MTKNSESGESLLVSMTGFGRAELESEGVRYTVELRSVNSRFLDCVCKLPRALLVFEKSVRDSVSKRFQRGRIEVMVEIQSAASQSGAGLLNSEFVSAQTEAMLQQAKTLGVVRSEFLPIALQLALQQRGAFDSPPASEQAEYKEEILLQCLEKACEAIEGMMREEGGQLAIEMRKLAAGLSDCRLQAASLLDGYVAKQFTTFKERIAELTKEESGIDHSRLVTELAVMADKLDVSEEITRLASHEQQLTDALCSTPCGRKVEFILQEFGREWNTLGVKSQHPEVHTIVVEAKVLLEKMREQVANLV
jgi:uncharacterized protein (TIGR00255 family)